MKIPRLLLAALAGGCVAASTAGAQPAAPASAPGDEALLLSPFQVSTTKDVGYEASETLSGTRLSTPNKFVGAAITDVTPALMQDLGQVGRGQGETCNNPRSWSCTNARRWLQVSP